MCYGMDMLKAISLLCLVLFCFILFSKKVVTVITFDSMYNMCNEFVRRRRRRRRRRKGEG